MFVDLTHEIAAYLYEVFVVRLDWWVLLGFIAQALFTMRFLVQWVASEHAARASSRSPSGCCPLGADCYCFATRSIAETLCSLLGRGSASSSICAIFILHCVTAENALLEWPAPEPQIQMSKTCSHVRAGHPCP